MLIVSLLLLLNNVPTNFNYNITTTDCNTLKQQIESELVQQIEDGILGYSLVCKEV
jgi:hypothetical protein